ncbi:MAG: MnmC family methyltransferase [Sulfurimonas sp.]|nr:MnmC family methyltransferase [Sulfurimonas sp.]
MHESLVKHVIPALQMKKKQKEIYILDICFGLGFNTLATLLYAQENNITSKINIYSPELDARLVKSLNDFTYPKEFDCFKNIIEILVKDGIYDDDSFHIEVFVGDAREYILKFEQEKFDVVYQDAFSPSSNPMLWTQEYFKDIASIIKKDGILTTYSIALATRLALHENDFYIYVNKGENYRDATLASLSKIQALKEVDVAHKISCNPDAASLRD